MSGSLGIDPDWAARTWRQCCEAVYESRADDVQKGREQIQTGFRIRLGVVRRTARLANAAANLGGRSWRAGEDLARALADMERLAERVFDRWKTKEDLEDLAAQDYPLPADKLKALAKKYPPPQAWYDEEHARP